MAFSDLHRLNWEFILLLRDFCVTASHAAFENCWPLKLKLQYETSCSNLNLEVSIRAIFSCTTRLCHKVHCGLRYQQATCDMLLASCAHQGSAHKLKLQRNGSYQSFLQLISHFVFMGNAHFVFMGNAKREKYKHRMVTSSDSERILTICTFFSLIHQIYIYVLYFEPL